ncbi:glycosyltransferase [Actinoplanes sp. NPDC024001]|uniref:glycosyltransferase n=1 Tax=Actinoplanes sp. NPDC024001 TaxID=3154598 RepID=UPI003411AB09
MTNISSPQVAVVTPWYPNSHHPFAGAFVQAMVEATAPGTDMTVYHCAEWGHRLPAAESAAVESAYETLLGYTHRPPRPTPTAGGARLITVPVPLSVGLSYAAIAKRHEVVLRSALGNEPLDAPVVHAHVGLPGGWAALKNSRPGARIFVTEHATFLDRVLEQPEARAMYDELLQHCAGFFAVGDPVRDPLVKAFPQHQDRIGYVPNPISFAAERAEPVRELRRWLFVGNLTERKGVQWLVEAFARCRADDPELTLTLVGDGDLRRALVKQAADLGVADAVRFTGMQPPEEALRLMREHDLLVHPSRFETFGMVVVEAVAAGMALLVTKCGGPEEILAGIEDAAGEMVDVEESSDALVAGYQRLRDRLAAGLDLRPVREQLAGRYGYPAVAEAHHGAWFAREGSDG